MLGVVGRERELQLVADFVASRAEGPAALVLEGEAGIGKTSVWSGVLEARSEGVRVLSAQPARAEASLAFAALTDLLDPLLDETLPDLSAPQRHALAVALLREEPGLRPLDQRAVAAATLSVLRAAAASGPVVLAIDDLQWLDPPTARVIEFVARRFGELPVRVLACERINEPDATHVDLERAMPPGRFQRIRLGPLSLGAIHEVLKDRLGHSFPRRTLVRIEQASGGNPFFAVELGRSLLEDGSNAAELPLPDKLRELVDTRIAGLPTDAREALLVAATAGSPTVDVVAGASSRSRSDTIAGLDQGVSAGLIQIHRDRVRFSHPLYAAALYSSAAPSERRQAHRALAPLIDDVEEQARHRALGAEGPDEGLAAALAQAAEHARRRGAPEVAADLAEHALFLTPRGSGVQRTRRTVQAAEHHFHADDRNRARALVESILELELDDADRAKALRVLGDVSSVEQSFFQSADLFNQALELAHHDAPTRLSIHFRLAFQLVAMGDFQAAFPHAQAARSLADEQRDPAARSVALAAGAMVGCLIGHGLDEEALAEALRLEDFQFEVPVQLRPSLVAGCLALFDGQLDRCDHLLSGLLRTLVDRGEEAGVPFVIGYLIWSACWQGKLLQAESYAVEALEISYRFESLQLNGATLAMASLASAYAGNEAQARARVQECFDAASRTGFNVALLWAAWALALMALSTDDPQAADDALEPATVMAEHLGIQEPARVFFLPDKIEALVGRGALERAEGLLDVFEEASLRLDRRWAVMMSRRCRALLLAARGDLNAASGVARDALERCQDLELRIEVARTFLVAGQIERRRRKKRDAAELLREALKIFEEAGARLWADRTRAELDRIGLRPAAPTDLTESERRVAELAASGLTNREVAAQLFISPKTVEANLARAYRKLGVRSRAELGARLGRDQDRQK